MWSENKTTTTTTGEDDEEKQEEEEKERTTHKLEHPPLYEQTLVLWLIHDSAFLVRDEISLLNPCSCTIHMNFYLCVCICFFLRLLSFILLLFRLVVEGRNLAWKSKLLTSIILCFVIQNCLSMDTQLWINVRHLSIRITAHPSENRNFKPFYHNNTLKSLYLFISLPIGVSWIFSEMLEFARKYFFEK